MHIIYSSFVLQVQLIHAAAQLHLLIYDQSLPLCGFLWLPYQSQRRGGHIGHRQKGSKAVLIATNILLPCCGPWVGAEPCTSARYVTGRAPAIVV